MRAHKFRVYYEFELDGILHKGIEEEASWFLLTQTGTLMAYGPMSPIKGGQDNYKKLIPLFYTGFKGKGNVEIYDKDICKFDISGLGTKYNKIESLLVVIKWEYGCWGYQHLYPEMVSEEDREWRAFWISDERDIWNPDWFEVIESSLTYKEYRKNAIKVD